MKADDGAEGGDTAGLERIEGKERRRRQAETAFSSLNAVSSKHTTTTTLNNNKEKHNSPSSSSSPPAPRYSPSSPSRHHCLCFRSKSYDPPADHRTGWRACGQAGGRPCPSGTCHGGLARSLLGWALLSGDVLVLVLVLVEGEVNWTELDW
jgi:hypothetical protein